MPRVSLPRGARLAPEAGREARVAQRQVGGVEDLAGVHRRQRDLARADEVQVVFGHVVDLLLGVGQHARAVERLLAHEHRRDDRLEALAAQLRHDPLHERELEHHEIAAQDREARARQPRAALHVDPLAGQLEVVAPASSVASPTIAQHLVLGLGGGRVGQVGQRAQDLLQLGLGLARLLAARLDLAREHLQVLERAARRRGPRACPRRPPRRPPSARRAAPRRPASPRASACRARCTRSRRSAACGPRRASAVRTASGSRRISLRSSTASEATRGRLRRAAGPAYFARNSATLRASCAGDEVLGHDRAGEAAVLDREEDVLDGLLAVVEVRAVDALAVGDVRTWSPACRRRSSVWQAAAALDEDLRARRGPDRPRRARCTTSRSRRRRPPQRRRRRRSMTRRAMGGADHTEQCLGRCLARSS